MLVLYIGSLLSLFLTSLYRLNDDGSGIVKTIGLQNYRTLIDKSVYFDIAVRTVKIAVIVTVIDVVLALPIAFWATPRKECLNGKGSDCVPFVDWIKAWTEIKG